MAYHRLTPALTAALRRGLENAFADAEAAAQRSGEPVVVQTLAREIVAECNGLTRGSSSVVAETDFIHGASLVSFDVPGRSTPACCEAGDLLVITGRTWRGAFLSIRAALFQAKRFRGTFPTTVRSRDKDQHFLYHYWPPITYSFGQHPPTRRIIAANRQFQGSRFLEIPRDPWPAVGSSVCVTTPNLGLGGPEPAPTYLLNMLRDHSAVPYQPYGPTEWDGFVDDLRLRKPTPRVAAGVANVFGDRAGRGREDPFVVLRLIVHENGEVPFDAPEQRLLNL